MENLKTLRTYKKTLVKCQAILNFEDKTYAQVLWVIYSIFGIMSSMNFMREFFI
jgi:hypothetical protein